MKYKMAANQALKRFSHQIIKEDASSLTLLTSFSTCEKVTRCKLLGKQLAGAKAFAASPDPPMADRHSVRISHGAVRNAGWRPLNRRFRACLAARFQREDSNRLFQTFTSKNAIIFSGEPVCGTQFFLTLKAKQPFVFHRPSLDSD